jgi:hypothetical protein
VAAVDLTAWNDALYVHYTTDRLYNLADKMNPTLGQLVKDTKAGGRHLSQGLIYEIGGGGSADLALAISESQASIPEEFIPILRQKIYEVAILDNETIEASAADRDAFAKAIDEIDRKFKAASNRMETKLFRGRGGWIGRSSTATNLASTVINLDDPADAFGFYKGQTIQFATTDGTSGAVLAGGPMTVASVQREAGTVTFTAQIDTTLTGETTTMFLFKNGDFGKGLIGFFDWCPIDRSTLGTAFFGVTRSDDPDRLAGIYFDGRGMPLFDVLIKVVGMLGKHSVQPDFALMNPDTMTDLILSAQGKTIIENTQVPSSRTQTIGYDTFKIRVGANVITLRTSWACPSTKMLVGVWDTWKLRSLGEMPKFLSRTGLLHQSENADTYQARVGGYGNLFCCAPGYNAPVQLA